MSEKKNYLKEQHSKNEFVISDLLNNEFRISLLNSY